MNDQIEVLMTTFRQDKFDMIRALTPGAVTFMDLIKESGCICGDPACPRRSFQHLLYTYFGEDVDKAEVFFSKITQLDRSMTHLDLGNILYEMKSHPDQERIDRSSELLERMFGIGSSEPMSIGALLDRILRTRRESTVERMFGEDIFGREFQDIFGRPRKQRQ